MLLSSEKKFVLCYPENQSFYRLTMLRRKDSNLRPLGYEPSELPSATTPLCYPYAKLKTAVFNIRTKKAAILTNSDPKDYDKCIKKVIVWFHVLSVIGIGSDMACVVAVNVRASSA